MKVETPTERAYLVSGVESSGRRKYSLVRAADAGAAGRILARRGLQDIWYHMDDEARVSGGRLSDNPAALEKMGVRAVLDVCEATRLERVGFSIGLAYRAFWIIAAPGAVLVAARRVVSSPLGAWDVLGLALMIYPLAHLWWAARWVRALRRLSRARADGDWAAVLRLGPRLRAELERTGSAGASLECLSIEAEAWAALGEFDKGMSTLDACSGSVDEIVLLLHKATLYSLFERHDEALRCCRAATDVEGAGFLPWYFLARVELVGFGRVREARAALAKAAAFPIAVKNRHLMQHAEACILLKESRPAEARALVEEALRWLDPRVSRWPGLALAAARCRLQLALALSRLGDRPAAIKTFARAEKILGRHSENRRWLIEARRELGLAGPPV